MRLEGEETFGPAAVMQAERARPLRRGRRQYSAARLLARKGRPHRHQDRLRRRRMRRLHGPDRRRTDALLPAARSDRPGQARRYHRIARPRRATLRRAARLPREARLAMRLLHARIHHGLGRIAAAKPRSERGRDPRGSRQQYLPVPRLREDHRGSKIRRGARQARRRAINNPVNKPMPVHNIGGYIPMNDGPEKVSGRAKYTADIVAPGQLAGRIYRSPYSHADIVSVDVSGARKVPGVIAVVTGADCDKGFGVLPIARTEYPLARDKVRY